MNKLLVLAMLGLAAGTYAYSLNRSLAANEAYSALAAFQPSIGLVAQNAIRFDPGKPVLYHILLHWFCGIFGHSEASIRAMSMLFGLTALLFAIFVLHSGQPGPWPRIAAQIRTSGSPVDPVVFESQPSGTHDAGGEFPNGFFRVPFDFYFHGSNPRLAISGADPDEAAKSVTAEVLNSGGAWLISAKGLQGATAELPRSDNVRIASVNQYSDVVVVHLLRDH